jgi:hypothetical protein
LAPILPRSAGFWARPSYRPRNPVFVRIGSPAAVLHAVLVHLLTSTRSLALRPQAICIGSRFRESRKAGAIKQRKPQLHRRHKTPWVLQRPLRR